MKRIMKRGVEHELSAGTPIQFESVEDLMYQYKCRILKVIDGDTVDVETDLGFDLRLNMRVRLSGIDAPEMNTPEGKAARLWLIDAMPVESEWTLATIKDRREKYGRYLGEFRQTEHQTINEMIVEAGHAIKKQW